MYGALAYRPDIDGLRAVAVLLVLVFHFQLAPGAKAGFIGVDMFFVISGFLITNLLMRQFDAGRFSLGDFYVARVRRLAPALTVVLLLGFAYGVWRLTPLALRELSLQTAAAQFYVSNLYYWQNFHYFGLSADSVYLLHTWSLAVEEQFYLLFPLVLWAVHRFARRWLWHTVALATLVSFGLNVAFVETRPMRCSTCFQPEPGSCW